MDLKRGGRFSITGRLVVSTIVCHKEAQKAQMKISLTILISLLVLVSSVAAQQTMAPAAAPDTSVAKLGGRWRVTFSLSGDPKKNLIFETKARGAGSFTLLDTGPDDKPVPEPVPAAWSELSNNRVSFSGEVELPLGNCCREIGTLIFKGKFQTSTTITGKLIFVTSIDEEESPYQFRSHVGTFSATRLD